jgi:thiol-disulfide isomerase/thioredoxin
VRRLAPSLGLLVILVAGVAYVVWGGGRVPWPLWGQAVREEEPAPLPPLPYATTPEIGRLAPDFLLRTAAGREVRLSGLLGKPVVVTFWTSWCPLCRSQLQDLKRLATAHRGRVYVLAVNRGEPAAAVTEFLQAAGGEGDSRVLLDPDEAVSRRYRITALPTTLYIDDGGVVRERRDDTLTYEDLRAGIGVLFERAWAP